MRRYIAHRLKPLLGALTRGLSRRSDVDASSKIARSVRSRDIAASNSVEGATAPARLRRFVFVSHCAEDKPKLKHLVDALVCKGVPIWIDDHTSLGMRPEECAVVEGIP